MTQALLEQEVRRQAMLQVMGLDVWLPRQQLPHAPPSLEWLLNWQPAADTPTAKPATSAPVPTQIAAAPAQPGTAKEQLARVRQSLQQEQTATSATPATTKPVTAPAAPETAIEIPRFSLQLLRSGSCLFLVDLPMGEPFQARDPEYLLFKDLLRAAGLGQQPAMLRNAEPIRWPLLSNNAASMEQDATLARDFVREIILLESSQQSTSLVWLLGANAVKFANQQDAEAEIFSLSPLQGQTQCWNLPGLEDLMRQPQLKAELWRSMQKFMPRWLQGA